MKNLCLPTFHILSFGKGINFFFCTKTFFNTLFRYLFKKALIEDDIAQQDAQDKRVMPPKEELVNEDNVKWDQGNIF